MTYDAIKAIILTLPRKVRKNDILFLDGNKKPFAGINGAGVWISVSKQNGKTWYFYMSTKDEETLGINQLKYSEQCSLAKEIVGECLAVQ